LTSDDQFEVGSLLALCRTLIDPEAQPLTANPRTTASPVLRARTSHGEVIVKRYERREKYEREVAAYRHWVPVLGAQAPSLLAAITNPPTIIITALPGRPLNEAALPPAAEQDAHERAGALLATFHTAEAPAPTTNIPAWLAARGEQWLALAVDLLDRRQLAEIRTHLHALADLGPLPTAPCHLDFTPGNLLRGDDGEVSLIDFEHARQDLPARDLVRLATRIWPARPDLEAAFLSGYGALTDQDRDVIARCSHLDHLTRAVRSAGRRPSV
jgi:tRNA A-37 threonylcarbamoyl transferase component Bud32